MKPNLALREIIPRHHLNDLIICQFTINPGVVLLLMQLIDLLIY